MEPDVELMEPLKVATIKRCAPELGKQQSPDALEMGANGIEHLGNPRTKFRFQGDKQAWR